MEVRKNTACLESEQEHLHSCFKVIDQQITLAKATLFVNPFHQINGEQACAIGHITCVDDEQVFKLLLDRIVEEVSDLGFSYLIGPMNGSTWNEYRLVTSQPGRTFLLDVVTPEYFFKLFKEYGFENLSEYKSTLASEIVVNWDKVDGAYHHFLSKGIEFSGFEPERAREEFRSLCKLCNSSFADNFLFSPLTEEAFISKMLPTVPLINPRYTWLAKKGEETVGFIFCYPDLMDKSKETIVVKTLARAPDKEFQGLGSVLSALAMKHAKDDGFTKGIHALMVISNSSTYISKKFKANFMRSYALMGLKIE